MLNLLTITSFITIVIITFHLPPRKYHFGHILPTYLLFIPESRKYQPILFLFRNSRWLKNVSTQFRQILKQRRVFNLRYCAPGYFVKYAAIAMPRRFFAQYFFVVIRIYLTLFKNTLL